MSAHDPTSWPWIGRFALELGLQPEDAVTTALERQAAEPTRPLNEFLEFSDEAREHLRAHLEEHRGALEREVEDEAFGRWALAKELVTPEALAAARTRQTTLPGSLLSELLLAEQELALERTPAVAQHRFQCASCDYLHLCHGGCHVVAKHTDGSFEALDPECPKVRRYRRHHKTGETNA